MGANKISINKHNLVQDTTLASNKKLIFGEAGEHIVGDGTDINVVSDEDINLKVGSNKRLQIFSAGTERAFIYVSTNLLKVAGSTSSVEIEIETSAAKDIVLDAGGVVKFEACAAGFDKPANYDDDTNVTIDFTNCNKAHLDLTGGSISGTLSLKFPDVSGNFVLVVEQDGSTRTIAAFKALDSAGNDADNDGGTGGAIRWSGGTAPDLTDGGSKRDILSFYWDADEEVCYGVASLNF